MSLEWSSEFTELLKFTATEAFDPKKQRKTLRSDYKSSKRGTEDAKHTLITSVYGEGGRECILKAENEGFILFTAIGQLFVNRWDEDRQRCVLSLNYLTLDGKVVQHGSGIDNGARYLDERMIGQLLAEVVAFPDEES